MERTCDCFVKSGEAQDTGRAVNKALEFYGWDLRRCLNMMTLFCGNFRAHLVGREELLFIGDKISLNYKGNGKIVAATPPTRKLKNRTRLQKRSE